jgi:hypothetical protein
MTGEFSFPGGYDESAQGTPTINRPGPQIQSWCTDNPRRDIFSLEFKMNEYVIQSMRILLDELAAKRRYIVPNQSA